LRVVVYLPHFGSTSAPYSTSAAALTTTFFSSSDDGRVSTPSIANQTTAPKTAATATTPRVPRTTISATVDFFTALAATSTPAASS
jgi:hypothetical protein